MGTGPDAGPGYDLALTELLAGTHRFYVQVGSEAGADLLEGVGWTPATRRTGGRAQLSCRAGARRHGALTPDGRAGRALLARNLEHPRWDEVAERCLSCTGNCTWSAPTCFSADVKDVSEVDGTVERRRRGRPVSTSTTPTCTGGGPADDVYPLSPMAHPQALDLVGLSSTRPAVSAADVA